MSAFFVGSSTIDDAVEVLKTWGHKRYAMSDRTKLGKRLWRMNAEALRQRYNDKPAEYAPAIKAYSAYKPSGDFFQLSKSAHCLRYQCSEGDVDETPLYRALSSAIDKLDSILAGPGKEVHDMPKYQAAAWVRL